LFCFFLVLGLLAFSLVGAQAVELAVGFDAGAQAVFGVGWMVADGNKVLEKG
jgi:hypothetical protein